MNNINISGLVQTAKNIVSTESIGLCICLLNQAGQKVFFISLGQIKPCSIKMSEMKAFTSYQFTHDNDEIYQLLKSLGDTPLISEQYCFIPGGKYIPNLFGHDAFLGVSSTDPSQDAKIADELVNYLYLGDKK
ncbi:heme-binding protein [Acinetobacter sp. B10A]|uniref:heme-binding protein n=1 Tax=Acinetobacter baretiae TaxID=2605383 RepID=UPI001B3C9C5E|nr:heme-binding protein [Acinetobacter baretiae]MBF7685104.1 heme-binding protein [Acinetobacter baretiae]